jgi:TolB-like protein
MNSIVLKLFTFIVICLFSISCASTTQEIDQYSMSPVEIHSLAVTPFTYESQQDGVIKLKADFLTESFYTEIEIGIPDMKIVSPDVTAEKIARLSQLNPSLPYKEAALEVAEGLGVDAVLMGIIYRYNDRVGGELGIESPASVAFGVVLINTKNHRTIWEARYDETQKPLTEDISDIKKFFKRKGKWVSADQLAQEGVSELVERIKNFLGQ